MFFSDLLERENLNFITMKWRVYRFKMAKILDTPHRGGGSPPLDTPPQHPFGVLPEWVANSLGMQTLPAGVHAAREGLYTLRGYERSLNI